MTARIQLILLVFAIAYSATFGSGHAQGSSAKRSQAAHRLLPYRLNLKRLVIRGRVEQPPPATETLGLRAVRFARDLLGTPYRYGGDSPGTGFDCSGFVRFVYRHFGLVLPHSSYADFALGVRVPRSSLRPGDLVFFDGVGHVGLYIGHGRFIHAPHTGTDVQVTSLSDPWYSQSYDGARRLLTRPVKNVARRLVTTRRLTKRSFQLPTGALTQYRLR